MASVGVEYRDHLDLAFQSAMSSPRTEYEKREAGDPLRNQTPTLNKTNSASFNECRCEAAWLNQGIYLPERCGKRMAGQPYRAGRPTDSTEFAGLAEAATGTAHL